MYVGTQAHQAIRLVDTLDGERVAYTALSYCWGPSAHITTRRNNYDQHLRNVPWSSLPATYRDAVELTRALKCEYVWIDALCIVQDDVLDWNVEASHMADVYSGAILVISAANANHVGFGFLNERSGSRTFSNKLKRNDPGRGREPTYVLVQQPTVHSDIMGDVGMTSSSQGSPRWPVLRRAWTLQERMLATRTVHFAAEEIIWECATASACECGHLQNTHALTSRQRFDVSSLDRLPDAERARLWAQLSLSYQNRLLTKEKDRLPALSGLAHRFQSDGLGVYLAGLCPILSSA
jgi:hypothetical protein